MKKKMTFYIETRLEHDLQIWINKHFELTGKKITKTDILNMLLKALLEADPTSGESTEQDIKEIQ